MSFSLVAEKRKEKGEQVRKAGKLPAIVYGKGVESESLSLEPNQFLKLYKQAGEASLIDLKINGTDSGKVLIQEVQYNPVTDRMIHVDLRRIDMNKPMTALVELRFIGEAPIVKSAGGTLVTAVQSVQVECLPKDLISFIEVDLSGIKSFEEVIKVKDLKIPSNVTIIDPNEDVLVAKAAPALTEEEIKAMEESASKPVDLEQIEVAGKKKEEESPEEGEAASKEATTEKKE